MIKKAFTIFFMVCILCTNVFAHTAQIVNKGDNKYKALRLTPQVYNLANSDLSDIRLKDEKGNIIPYFINSSYSTSYQESYIYPMIMIDSFEKDDFFYFDYKIDKDYDRDILATSIALNTKNEGFAKRVNVSGSYDGVKWTNIQEDTIYNVDNNSNLEIKFSATQKYTHYRLKLSNNLEKLSFDNVELYYSEEKSKTDYFIEKLMPEYTVEEKGKETHINISGLTNLRLDEITIGSDDVFKRDASTPNGVEEIYNLSFGNESYSDTSLQMNQYVSKRDIFTVVIHNKDDKPIQISSVAVKYYTDELVFDGSAGGSFVLEFGADDTLQKPAYDIANYKSDVLRQQIDKLEISNISVAQPAQVKKEADYTLVFNITVVIVAIILGAIILVRLKR